jgi:2-polyprenyl-6-methoxyphenol hydroxylase-like FAD-dependent oxidoreductase
LKKTLCLFKVVAFKICDKKFRKYLNMSGTQGASSSRGRPEIDRIQLRQILVDSLPEGMIRWGHHLKSVEVDNDSVNLIFNTGIESGYDLIVGADGAWSHVRELLTEVKPQFTGIAGVRLSISEPESRCPDLYAITNRGSMFSFSDAKALMAQQMGDGSLMVGTWAVKPENWIKQLNTENSDADVMKKILLEEYDGWAPELRKFLEASNGPHFSRNLYQLPIGLRWKNRPGVTILGDAAHLMSPFAGEGVNLAMTDAMQLASAITKAIEVGTTEALVKETRAFEEDMYVRATKFQQLTAEMMGCMFFTPGAPDSSVEKYVIAAAGHDMNPVLRAGFVAGVYTYFWFWRWFN